MTTEEGLRCPFCGAPETDRLDLEGRRFLVFSCLFTPEVDRTLPEAELARALRGAYRPDDPAYFRGMCDRLHLYVTKGDGAHALLASPEGTGEPPDAPPPPVPERPPVNSG